MSVQPQPARPEAAALAVRILSEVAEQHGLTRPEHRAALDRIREHTEFRLALENFAAGLLMIAGSV
ncbi:MAG: hypothetical protein ACREE4_03845 [Stellaceae bacterium]